MPLLGCFFKSLVYKKHERFISICLHLLSPSGTSSGAAPAAAVLNHPSLWNCRTDLGIRNSIPTMDRSHHSDTEGSTSLGGTMDFTGRWERLKNKKKTKKNKQKSFGRDLLESFNPFYACIQFSSKSNKYWQWTSKTTQRLIYWPNPPHSSLSHPHLQQRHNTSSPAVIWTISSIAWMAEPFPEKSFFTHLQGGIEKNPLQFLPGSEVQQQGPARGKPNPKGWGVDGITNLCACGAAIQGWLEELQSVPARGWAAPATGIEVGKWRKTKRMSAQTPNSLCWIRRGHQGSLKGSVCKS